MSAAEQAKDCLKQANEKAGRRDRKRADKNPKRAEKKKSKLHTKIELEFRDPTKRFKELQDKLKSLDDKFNLHNVSLTGDDDPHKRASMFAKQEEKPTENLLSLVDIGMGSRTKMTRLSTAENIRKALD